VGRILPTAGELGLVLYNWDQQAPRQRPFRSSWAKLPLFRVMGPTGHRQRRQPCRPSTVASVRKLALFRQGHLHVQSTITRLSAKYLPLLDRRRKIGFVSHERHGTRKTGMVGIPTGGNWLCLVRSTFRHTSPSTLSQERQVNAAGLHVIFAFLAVYVVLVVALPPRAAVLLQEGPLSPTHVCFIKTNIPSRNFHNGTAECCARAGDGGL